MKSEDRDQAYLWDMRDFAREARRIVRRIAYDRMQKDSMRRLALERVLELLGEVARRVSPETRRAHPEIEWRDLIGQRNVLAHDYGEIDHRRLYDTARMKVPLLIDKLDRILDGG
jgi:uncharacterized protein with HEPN domain